MAESRRSVLPSRASGYSLRATQRSHCAHSQELVSRGVPSGDECPESRDARVNATHGPPHPILNHLSRHTEATREDSSARRVGSLPTAGSDAAAAIAPVHRRSSAASHFLTLEIA
jgi:hypothetical protein